MGRGARSASQVDNREPARQPALQLTQAEVAAQLKDALVRETQLRLKIKELERTVFNLTTENNLAVEDIRRLNTQLANLAELNEELTKPTVADIEIDTGKSFQELYNDEKQHRIELQRQFDQVNDAKTAISKLCTEERNEKNKLKAELESLKKNPMVKVVNPSDYATLKTNNELYHRTIEIGKKQLQEARMENRALRGELWKVDLTSPPSYSLFHAYELQRDNWLAMVGKDRGCLLDSGDFDVVWAASSRHANQQNLICEMIARGDVQLTDQKKLFLPIGHLGARVVLYYTTLEEQLQKRRQLDMSVESHRLVKMGDSSRQVVDIAEKVPSEELKEWTVTLEGLLKEFDNRDNILVKLSCVLERETYAQRGELTTAHYVYGMHKVRQQIMDTLRELKKDHLFITSHDLQVELTLPPPTYKAPGWLSIRTPVTGSPLTVKYLGNYASLFDNEAVFPLPTWTAIEWLLEDYGLSRREERSWDLIYKEIVNVNWTDAAPEAVRTNGHFCDCKRRFKWAPDSLIDSVEYNWPLIPGQFDTALNCATAYEGFWQIHHTHTDPVCFRAAIFSKFLARICRDFKVVVNVNRYDERRPEFLINLKLRYHSSRWGRMLEVMAMTHFLIRV